MLHKRSPQKRHPRTINSDYLLGGLLYCGKCGATMVGCSGESSRYRYSACRTQYSRGKGGCDTRMICRRKLDAFVIGRLREHILTERNLEGLVRLTHEEIAQAREESEGRLGQIDQQLAGLKGRLDKLYDAMGTGQLDLGALAPRTRDLKAQSEGVAATLDESHLTNANRVG